MNPIKKLIPPCEDDAAEILRQSGKQLEANLAEKLQPLNEIIRAGDYVCAEYRQSLKRRRAVENLHRAYRG